MHSAATSSAMNAVSAICSRVLDKMRRRSAAGSSVKFFGKSDAGAATVRSNLDAIAASLFGRVEPLVRGFDQLV